MQTKKYNALATKGQFEFDGLLIQRQKKSTNFLLPNEGNKQVTPYEIIKRLAGKDSSGKDIFKSYQKQIKFQNNKIQVFHDAERTRNIWFFRKQYKMPPQLENKLANLLKEKKKIEDSTGVTAAREREEQRQRDEAIRKQQERERYNAERKAKRLENPSKKKNEPSL